MPFQKPLPTWFISFVRLPLYDLGESPGTGMKNRTNRKEQKESEEIGQTDEGVELDQLLPLGRWVQLFMLQHPCVLME